MEKLRTVPVRLGIALRVARRARKESITAAAQKIGLDRGHLSDIEAGEVEPRFRLVKKLLAYYNIQLDDVL